MEFCKRNISMLLIIVTLSLCSNAMRGIAPYAREKGFVYLDEIDPTIQVSLRYYSDENFLGRRVNAYNKNVLMITRQAAQALKRVQEDLKKDGYELVIYDAYRPQDAVDNFIDWSMAINDQIKKAQYYPRVDKARVFELGYVAKKSGHTRGSTVDLTIIKKGKKVHDVVEQKRTLLDGFTIIYLDDGTVDMGSSFDLFDVASHYENSVIPEEYKKMRTYLHDIMIKHGFNPYSEEWWHFTLANEPHPASHGDGIYFNFPVE